MIFLFIIDFTAYCHSLMSFFVVVAAVNERFHNDGKEKNNSKH